MALNLLNVLLTQGVFAGIHQPFPFMHWVPLKKYEWVLIIISLIAIETVSVSC